jgi:hypothetical protein
VGKAAEEREVFEEFATVAGLAIDPGSIRSEAPPLPDISCRIGGDTRYFELTRAANQGIADEVGRLLVRGRKTGEGGVGRPQVHNDATCVEVPPSPPEQPVAAGPPDAR